MLMVISPAKTLDYSSNSEHYSFTKPDYIEQSQILIDILKQYSPQEISKLMKISDKLASLNSVRFMEWSKEFNLINAKQAVFAFKGDVYTGLNINDLNDEDLVFAQEHLRILSGLYGLLRPLDLMQPYRLEMGTKLKNSKGNNLYDFWSNIITNSLNEILSNSNTKLLINLASNEYFKSINKNKFTGQIIDIEFKDKKNGEYKIISFYAKKARGMMANFIIKNKITNIEKLKEFNYQQYYFNSQSSTPTKLVFYRD